MILSLKTEHFDNFDIEKAHFDHFKVKNRNFDKMLTWNNQNFDDFELKNWDFVQKVDCYEQLWFVN